VTDRMEIDDDLDPEEWSSLTCSVTYVRNVMEGKGGEPPAHMRKMRAMLDGVIALCEAIADARAE
jgi:hypothetical protein